MKSCSYPQPFDTIWEYLDFRRHKSEISCLSHDGLMTATLKQHGSWLSYTLAVGEDAKFCTTFDIFRATAVRLRAFHLGCARIALHMKRYQRTGDSKWLKIDRPFGPLHGGARTVEGGYMWRGTKDDIDTDVWLDLVEDEKLARLLSRVDSIGREQSQDADQETSRTRAWELLRTIPERHENHVEVLRRRLMFKPESQNREDLQRDVRWTRLLVEAEPYDVTNWWSLDWAVEALEGKAAAAEVLREGILRHGPDFTLHYALASHLCALGRLDEAREQMLLALKQDPFALKSAMASDCFAPIHDFIREQADSDWFREESERLGIPDPLQGFSDGR